MNRLSLQRLRLVFPIAALGMTLGPRLALAHTGVSPAHDLLHGIEHPLAGVDHLLAMIAVGLWAAQRGSHAIWSVPLTFVAIMTLGGVVGMSGVLLPFVEPGIILSVIFLGVFVAAAVRLPLLVSATIVGLFASVHGYAHGVEIPASASGFSYAVGFAAATAVLHAAGIGFGLAMQQLHWSQLVRSAGVAIAVCGLYLGIR